MELPFYLGAPMWSMDSWRGRLFTREAKSRDYLGQYGEVFTTVEGNNTFYGLPKPETVHRWAEEVPSHFRFCFKFPRTITHDVMLGGQIAEDATANFLQLLAPIQNHIGQLFLQLSPSFNEDLLDRLDHYLANLPRHFRYCAEPRHADFFNHQASEEAFDAILTKHDINRALFHTSSLHALDPSNADRREAQRKKPDYPDRFTTTSQEPFIRVVGHEDVAPNESLLQKIADQAAQWIHEGRRPYLFVHSPGDHHVPELGRRLHELMRDRLGLEKVPAMPPWPGETEPPAPTQLDLF